MALLIVTVPLFADYGTARDLLDTGTAVKISGVLEYNAPYWYLVSGGKSYQLHLGNMNFLSNTGITLKEGSLCEVEGIAGDDDIVVFGVTTNEKTYRLRDENGVPLWAGGRYREEERNSSNRTWLRRGRCCDDARPYGQGLFQNRN